MRLSRPEATPSTVGRYSRGRQHAATRSTGRWKSMVGSAWDAVTAIAAVIAVVVSVVALMLQRRTDKRVGDIEIARRKEEEERQRVADVRVREVRVAQAGTSATSEQHVFTLYNQGAATAREVQVAVGTVADHAQGRADENYDGSLGRVIQVITPADPNADPTRRITERAYCEVSVLPWSEIPSNGEVEFVIWRFREPRLADVLISWVDDRPGKQRAERRGIVVQPPVS